MKRNRTKVEAPYVDWVTRNREIKSPYVHSNVVRYAALKFENELSQLYYGDLYILPLTVEGEEYRMMLFEKYWIGQYGAYEINFTYNGEVYLAILVNND
jgi:hypothetical protein